MKKSLTALNKLSISRRAKISISVSAGLIVLLGVIIGSSANLNRFVAQAAPKTTSGEWTAEFYSSKPGEIQMTFHRHSENGGFNTTSDSLSLSELRGLTPEALTSAKTNVNFNIVREAGTFACEGYFREGRGVGLWTLTPSEKFISDMRARGYNNLSDDDLTRSAFNNLTTKFIDDLKSVGYANIEFSDLMRANNHDVDSAYIKQVKSMGFENQPLEMLIRMRNHDITPEFAGEMRSAGFSDLSIDDLIRLKNHDVTLSFINDLKAEGYTGVPVDTAISLKNHEIDRDFIRRAKAQGFTAVSLDELVRLRNRGTVK